MRSTCLSVPHLNMYSGLNSDVCGSVITRWKYDNQNYVMCIVYVLYVCLCVSIGYVLYVCLCVSMFVCVCTVYVSVSMYMYLYVYVCVCVCICVCVYVHAIGYTLLPHTV